MRKRKMVMPSEKEDGLDGSVPMAMHGGDPYFGWERAQKDRGGCKNGTDLPGNAEPPPGWRGFCAGNRKTIIADST